MSAPPTTASVPPFTAPVAVVDDFLPAELAARMRADIVAHFGDPSAHRPPTHQIWNYWYVPGLYTYLRTQPEKVIDGARVTRFIDLLRAWSAAALGLGQVSWPYLSLYVGGCRQSLHNDSANGRFAFVYSLTAAERRTVGGETIILREGDPFRRNLRTPNAGHGLYDLVEPRFNRLVVFDDRMVHGVEPVAGSMDPLDGRVVLHGHLSEGGPIVIGALPFEALRDPLREAFDAFLASRSASLNLYHGPLSVRLAIGEAGNVAETAVVLDRVAHPAEGDTEWETLRAEFVRRLGAIRFPPAAGATVVILPVAFGGPLRRSEASPTESGSGG